MIRISWRRQIACYDHIRGELQRAGAHDEMGASLLATALAGLVTTTLAAPFDVLKTRVMAPSSRVGLAAAAAELGAEGLRGAMRGWLPSCACALSPLVLRFA